MLDECWLFCGFGIYAQRYNSAGVKQGLEFRVNTFVSGDEIEPAVAMDSSGRFVIAWSSMGQDGSGMGVYAQRYDSAGAKIGGEFRVNSTTPDYQRRPSAAMDSAGDFVIAWMSFGQDGDSFVRFALIENEHRTRQALRGIRTALNRGNSEVLGRTASAS